MGKGIKGLEYLPKISIINAAGVNCSVQAYRSVLYKIQFLQANVEANEALTDELCRSNQPYFDSIWDITSTAAVAAIGTVTCDTVVDGDTVTVNGLIYTGVDGTKADDTEFQVNIGDDTDTAMDLAASITNDTRIGLTNVSVDVTATFVLGVVTIIAVPEGLDGNLIDLASSDGATLAVSGAFLTGGANRTYTIVFKSETWPEIDTINPPGLSTKRLLDIAFTGVTFAFTVRSVLSAINFIEGTLEVRESSAVSATGTVTALSPDAYEFADGTITCATVLEDDTVTVNSFLYTAKVAGSGNTEFTIGGDNDATAANLRASIISRDPLIAATGAAAIVTVTSKIAGTAGNAITLSSSGATLAVSGALLTGGVDGDSVTINGEPYFAVESTKFDDTQFDVSGTDIQAATDLADSISDDTRQPGVVTGSSTGAVVTVIAIDTGEDGNAITLVTSDVVKLAISGATLTGGIGFTTNGTYTDAIFKGATPFLTFTWTVEKDDDVYTLTSTASS